MNGQLSKYENTVFSRSRDPFYIETSYIKWVTNSWTHSILMLLLNATFKVASSTLGKVGLYNGFMER